MSKTIFRFFMLTAFITFATPSWSCPAGYAACGSQSQLCCPS